MIAEWVLFPGVLAILALGCGLLVERLVSLRLPGALLPAVGLAGLIVVGQFLTLADASAELTTPAAVVLAVGGIGLSNRRALGGLAGWALAAAGGAFAAYAAPIVLSGEATFAGYIKLDDTATWMALTDRVMDHGRSLDGLSPSTYEATLSFNLGDGYPIGAFLPLGIGSRLTGEDVAWVIQPYMGFLGALLALALWQLGERLVLAAPLRAAVAAVAAQPALLYGYYLWGGVKEVAAAALLASIAALAAQTLRRGGRRRHLVPLALAGAATVGVLSGGGALWLIAPLLGALVVLGLELGGRVALRRGAGIALLTAAFSVPTLVVGGLLPPTSSPLTSGAAQGNLLGSLEPLQAAGIWPAGDFRLGPEVAALTYPLIAVAAVGAVAAVTLAVRRRAWAPPIYVLGSLAACLVICALGSPWVDGKALAIASPAVPFAAGAFGAALYATGHRPEGIAVLVAIAAGILWSNALAYRDVSLAPRDQLGELERIGGLIAGRGPTLMTEYQPYGTRHFLREADPEGVSELRRRRIPLRDGSTVRKGLSADTDQLAPPGLLLYRTLVLRRSPAHSRPPSPYRLTWSGDHYEVWQREGPVPAVAHLGLGSETSPVARAPCQHVRRLADRAPPGGTLLAARRPAVIVLRSVAEPATVRVSKGASYEAWLLGSVRSSARLEIDGERLESVRHRLNNAGQWLTLGRMHLAPGPHRLELLADGADLHPGSGGSPPPSGPLVLARGAAAGTRLVRTSTHRAGRLCGRRLDWIEAVGG